MQRLSVRLRADRRKVFNLNVESEARKTRIVTRERSAAIQSLLPLDCRAVLAGDGW
jgi:hypothetical protein